MDRLMATVYGWTRRSVDGLWWLDWHIGRSRIARSTYVWTRSDDEFARRTWRFHLWHFRRSFIQRNSSWTLVNWNEFADKVWIDNGGLLFGVLTSWTHISFLRWNAFAVGRRQTPLQPDAMGRLRDCPDSAFLLILVIAPIFHLELGPVSLVVGD